jgi:SEC-C motif
VGLTLIDALGRPPPCVCDCFNGLTVEERAQGIGAMFRFDDAIRGWGYLPLYEPAAPALWRAAQKKNDTTYRCIAVRDEACVYRRLVGFAVHETIHALEGDTSLANYGVPFGLPYGVPVDLPEGDEKDYLNRFNVGEARAWVGVAPLGRALFGIDWELRTARDVGTYGFPGGNAIVDVPPGFRPVPHVDRQLHPQRYYALARRLEDEARNYFTDERLTEMRARFETAETAGQKKRKQPWPDPLELARIPPSRPGRNDLCVCGSGKKFKKCCGA